MSIPLRALPQGLEQVFDKWHLTNPLELDEPVGTLR